MASSLLRMHALNAARQSRCFSTTPRQCAAQVKSLGVIGAGQMVGHIRQLLDRIYR